LDAETGRNLFSDENGQPTDLFYGMIGGLQKYLPNALVLLAPYVNSYRRFKADDAAPVNFEWGSDNRTTGIRIPISGPEERRVENRVVGMDCNPYLAIAANLACGYLGMKAGLRPGNPNSRVAYGEAIRIPRSLNAALRLFAENQDIRGLLGQEFCAVYERIKKHEHDEFLSEISAWEREHLLLNV
jgi:glutamine synthetase